MIASWPDLKNPLETLLKRVKNHKPIVLLTEKAIEA